MVEEFDVEKLKQIGKNHKDTKSTKKSEKSLCSLCLCGFSLFVFITLAHRRSDHKPMEEGRPAISDRRKVARGDELYG
jgi:hypothetical protein